MNRLLWTGLLGTLGLTAWVALTPEDESAMPTAGAVREPPPQRSAAAAAATAAGKPLADLRWPSRLAPAERPPWPGLPQKQSAGWAPPAPPPPPPPAPAPPPPPPKAPEFGYQVIGSLEDGGVVQVMLANTVRTLVVKKGEVIDGQWRVETLGPAQITLLWLPGQLPRTLSYRSP